MLNAKTILAGLLAAGMVLSGTACGQASALAEKAGQMLTSVQEAADTQSEAGAEGSADTAEEASAQPENSAEPEAEKTYVCYRETYSYEADGTTYSTVTDYGYDTEGRVTAEYFFNDAGMIESVEFTEYFGDTELVQKTEEKRFYAGSEQAENVETTVYGLYTNRKGEPVTAEQQYMYRSFDETGAVTYELQTAFHVNEFGEIQFAEAAENGEIHSRMDLTYDENGNGILQIDRVNRGSYDEMNKKEYSYDENGNCTRLLIWHGDANSEYLFDREVRYEYDEQGRLCREIETNYENDLSVDCTVTDYNENGDMEMVVYTNVDSALDHTNLYIRDEAGRLIEESYNGVRFRSVEYDEAGNELFAYTYGEDGVTVDGRTEYTYDEHGNRVQMKRYNVYEDGSEKLLRWIDYEYMALQ